MGDGLLQAIPPEEITFHSLSFGDPTGRLFWWRGKLYRAISAARSPLFRQMLRDGFIESLVQKGLLVPTRDAPLELAGYDMVLEHEVMPFVSYATEWCGTMLKDAALTVLDLELELLGRGLTLQDAHPWNVLFRGGLPLYVDIGSIGPADLPREWKAQGEFRRFFLSPLTATARGHGAIARALLQDLERGVLPHEAALFESPAQHTIRGLKEFQSDILRRSVARLPERVRRSLSALRMRMGTTRSGERPNTHVADVSTESPLRRVRSLRTTVSSIEPRLRTSAWSKYSVDSFPSFNDRSAWTAKHASVERVLRGLAPESVLDAASNTGWFSQLAAHLGARVVALDTDESSIEELYRSVRAQGLDILPLVMNLKSPTPAMGVANSWAPPATSRLRSSLVLALAIVHHLVFKERLSFEQVVAAFEPFVESHLLIEFVPAEDRYVKEWSPDAKPWYRLDEFVAVLGGRFEVCEVLPSFPEPRVLVLCARQRDATQRRPTAVSQ